MGVRRLLRTLVLACSVLVAAGSITASLQAQEEKTGFSAPTAAVPLPGGGMLVTDYKECTVTEVDEDGVATVVAGVPDQCGGTGDGGPATAAKLTYPTDAVPTADGGFLVSSYWPFDCRIRKVDANGIITTVAGHTFFSCGTGGEGDGGPATHQDVKLSVISVVPFNAPGAAVDTPGEGFLIAGACDVRKVDGDGKITTVAGNHTCGGSPASAVSCVPGFCAVGRGGGIVSTSTNPTAGAPEWRNTKATQSGGMNELSCASSSVCAATDNTRIYVSGNAGSQDAKWNQTTLDTWGLSCTSASFCVAGDGEDAAVHTSTNPTAANPTWTRRQIGANDDPVTAVSCLGTTFCAATTLRSNKAYLSTNPTAASPSWKPDAIAPGSGFIDISCPSTALCVAVGGDEELYVSTNPTAADPTWTGQGITQDPDNLADDVRDVSCPTADLCVAITGDNQALTSKNPRAADPDWERTLIHPRHGGGTLDVSCGSVSLCMAVETVGGGDPESAHLLVSADPGDPASWTAKPSDSAPRDGAPARTQTLRTPTAAVPTADGGFLVTEVGTLSGPDAGLGSRVRKVLPDGTMRTVAGTGQPGYSGDNGPATSAQLNQPTSAVPTADGGFLIAELRNCVVRKVNSAGIIQRVAGVAPNGGTPSCGTAGSGGNARSAQLFRPTAAVPFPDGSFVIGAYSTPPGQADNAPVRRVLPSGNLVSAIGPAVDPGPGPDPDPDPGPGNGGDPPGGGDPPVVVPPPPPPGGGGSTVFPPSCTLKAASTKVDGPKPKGKRKRKGAKKPGVLKAAVTCSQTATVRAAGELVLTPKKKGRRKPKPKTVTLRSKTATAQPGAPLTLRLKVPKSTLKAILKGGKASVDLALAATGTGGQSTAAAKIARLGVRRQT